MQMFCRHCISPAEQAGALRIYFRFEPGYDDAELEKAVHIHPAYIKRAVVDK